MREYTKKFARAILALAVLTPLLVGNAALAVDANASTTTTTPNASTSTSDSTSTTLTDQQKADLAKRLADRKAQLKTVLTAARQLKIKTKCTTSQGVISSLSGRIKGIETSRTEVYANISNSLTKLSTQLKNKNIDTTAFNTEISTLKTKVTTFNTDLTAYKQATADLKDMDCAADPTAFQSSLDAARTARDKVAKDAADIRTYLTDTIKPTLKDLRAQVAGTATSTSSSSSSSTTTTTPSTSTTNTTTTH